MPLIEFSDEEVQQLTLVLANASGPGVSWMLTNSLLTKLQQQAASQKAAEVLSPAEHVGNSEDKGYAAVSRPRR